jgi:magnesium-dependent phosphatase 1
MYIHKYNKYLSKLQNSYGGVVNSEAAPEPRQRSAIFSEGPNPPLFVFDCDYTIWPYDCDGPHPYPYGRDVYSPFTRLPNGYVHDKYGNSANSYPDVPFILGALYDAGIQVAYASRNKSSGYVEELLRSIPLQSQQPGLSLWDCLRGRRDLFHAYGSGGQNNKLLHFTNIRNVSGIDFPNMVFFDDNNRNVAHAETLGIISILLTMQTGLTWDAIDNVLRRWRAKT